MRAHIVLDPQDPQPLGGRWIEPGKTHEPPLTARPPIAPAPPTEGDAGSVPTDVEGCLGRCRTASGQAVGS